MWMYMEHHIISYHLHKQKTHHRAFKIADGKFDNFWGNYFCPKLPYDQILTLKTHSALIINYHDF